MPTVASIWTQQRSIGARPYCSRRLIRASGPGASRQAHADGSHADASRSIGGRAQTKGRAGPFGDCDLHGRRWTLHRQHRNYRPIATCLSLPLSGNIEWVRDRLSRGYRAVLAHLWATGRHGLAQANLLAVSQYSHLGSAAMTAAAPHWRYVIADAPDLQGWGAAASSAVNVA